MRVDQAASPANDAALSNRNDLALLRNFVLVEFVSKNVLELIGSVSNASWVSADGRSVVKGRTRHDHVAQFHFVTRTHDCQIGNASHVRQIVTSVVGGSVVSDKTTAIEHHSHGKILNGNVVDDLIVSSLHKGAVDAHKGFEALACHARAHADGVLFGNSNVKGTLRESSSKNVHSGSARHGGGDSDNAAVLNGGIDQCVGKNRRKGGFSGLALVLGARAQVELADSVHSIARGFGGRISVSLGGLDVQQDGLVAGRIPQFLQDGNQIVQIVAVNGSDIVKAEFFKQGSSAHKTTRVLVDALVDALYVFRKKLVEGFGKVTEILKGLAHQQIGSVGGKLRSGNGSSGTGSSRGQTDLSVVVEYDNHSRLQISGRVHGLVGHSSGNSSVSNHGHAIVFALVEDALGNGHALCRTDGRGRMAGTKGIVLALFALAKSRKSAQLPQSGKPIPAARQNLVGIALVGNVPNDIVRGHVKDIVQSDREFGHSQTRGQVTSRFGDTFQNFPSQFVCQLLELAHVQALHVLWIIDAVQNGLDGRTRIGRTRHFRRVFGIQLGRSMVSTGRGKPKCGCNNRCQKQAADG
mmetsp:Transcript_5954/g.14411  ORF Transcript_5954/g.14411 Transcript_5954/m.14411 type:complete len:580 (-) Transcript_5954:153-1892(-)